MEELDFPPYRVDLYLPDYHMAVEIDGPLHNIRQDEKRDNDLFNEYKLLVFRISSRYLRPFYWLDALRDILLQAQETRDERWEQAELKLPWI
jgi:very-short-patch-repair endonuclease